MVGGRTLGFICTKNACNITISYEYIRVHNPGISNHLLISAIDCARIVCASVARRTPLTALHAPVRLCTSVQ